jgi:hypothetical protein
MPPLSPKDLMSRRNPQSPLIVSPLIVQTAGLTRKPA